MDSQTSQPQLQRYRRRVPSLDSINLPTKTSNSVATPKLKKKIIPGQPCHSPETNNEIISFPDITPMPQERHARKPVIFTTKFPSVDASIMNYHEPKQAATICSAPITRVYHSNSGTDLIIPYKPINDITSATSHSETYTPTSNHQFNLKKTPILNRYRFFIIRILCFPKTVLGKCASAGRSCIQRVSFTNSCKYQHSSHQRLNNHQRVPLGRLSSNDLNQNIYQEKEITHECTSSSRFRLSRMKRGSELGSPKIRENLISSRIASFLNSYDVQIAMICICLTGESLAQSVLAPFLYYLVRDFHVGPDIWIGYYAGLLWTGFWAANLATSLIWGHLSDKYGRKVVLVSGLITTSISTLFLGLSKCYHDAMLIMVIQGAFTGLVPVSKCAIGEMANRRQHEYDIEVQTLRCDSSKLDNVPGKKDFASRGYSAIVISLALGAARPLVGGSLSKKKLRGYESYTYFTPCLVAAIIGLFLAGIVSLVLNETHPKWTKPLEIKSPLLQRSGHKVKKNVTQDACRMSLAVTNHVHNGHKMDENLDQFSDDREPSQPGACDRVKQQTTPNTKDGLDSVPLKFNNLSNIHPATELYLILIMYTLLVLTSILGSEFIMLYTQTPVIQGGLGFSASVFGRVLTIRGIVKLAFNILGYPIMVFQYGLQKCLKIGIFIIGAVSVLGLGMFAPWNVYNGNTQTSSMNDGDNAEPIGLTAILICLSAISIGDVLGYISVLVLFGKAADRLKGTQKAVDIDGIVSEDIKKSHSGSGVLWSLAQASANLMRLIGPIAAGLVWSATEKSTVIQSLFTSLRHASLLQHIGGLLQSAPTLGSFFNSLCGSTQVFFLIGFICVINYIICYYWTYHSSLIESRSTEHNTCD